MLELKNEHLTATFITTGAELTSLKDTKGTEYLLTLEEKQLKMNRQTFKTLNSQSDSRFYFGKNKFSYVHL